MSGNHLQCSQCKQIYQAPHADELQLQLSNNQNATQWKDSVRYPSSIVGLLFGAFVGGVDTFAALLEVFGGIRDFGIFEASIFGLFGAAIGAFLGSNRHVSWKHRLFALWLVVLIIYSTTSESLLDFVIAQLPVFLQPIVTWASLLGGIWGAVKYLIPKRSCMDQGTADWYFKDQADLLGPLTAKELRQLAVTDRIGSDTLVRKGNDGRWVSASRVRGLFDDHAYIP